MFFQSKPKSLELSDPYRTKRLQDAQLSLARLLKVERLGHNVIIERTIAEIEVSRLLPRSPFKPFHGLKMLATT